MMMKVPRAMQQSMLQLHLLKLLVPCRFQHKRLHGAQCIDALVHGIHRRAADNARAAAGDDASDSSHIQTASEMRVRYLNADQSEVSDPELLLLLNYGEDSEEEEEEESLEG